MGAEWAAAPLQLPIVQGKTTWPGNVHAGSEKGRYDLSLKDGVFDDGVNFVWSDTTIPDRLSCRSTNL